jgi:hypothetical protein
MMDISVKRFLIWEWSELTPWLVLLGSFGGLCVLHTVTVLPTWINRTMMAFGAFLLFTYSGKIGLFIIGPKTAGLAAVVSVFAASLLSGPSRSTLVQVGLGLLSACVLMVGNSLRRAEFANIQAVRDQRALEVFRAVIGGAPPRYALYLRPFITRNRLLVQAFSQSKGKGGGTEEIDLETILALSFPRTVPLIGLGAPGQILEAKSWEVSFNSEGLQVNFASAPGVGMIKTTEEQWRSTFEALASAAELLLIIPYAYPGTLWELEWIKAHGRLDTCIFIMPESIGRDDKREAWFEAEWRKGMEAAGKLGIELPPYHRRGMVFKVSQTGVVTGAFRLNANLGRAPRVRRLIKRLTRASLSIA